MIYLGTGPSEEKLVVISLMVKATSPEDIEMMMMNSNTWQMCEREYAGCLMVACTPCMNSGEGPKVHQSFILLILVQINFIVLKPSICIVNTDLKSLEMIILLTM